MKAVILAGGLATRMGELCYKTPKSMTTICGKPVLQIQIEALKAEGIRDFTIVVCHLSEIITEFFGDGASLGVNITYFFEKEPLGTAGALFKMNFEDDFLLCNGDLIFNFSLNDMLSFHKNNHALATLFAHPNDHPLDSTLICTDKNGKVTHIVPSDENDGSCRNLCNAGIQIVSPALLKSFSFNGYANFDKDIITPALSTGKIFAYKSFEYVHDMGTPERLKKTKADLSEGIVEKSHKSHLQKAIFLDRDGTLNRHKGYIASPEEIELIDNVAKALKMLKQMGYLLIIITNQPVIARGDCTEEVLEKIHGKLEMLLGEEEAFVDHIYYCPHHPDSGFEGEIAELKLHCNCRKPAPGLILKAQRDFNIDLGKSYMVGDSENDLLAGKNAGCTSILLSHKSDHAGTENVFRSLYDFALALSDDSFK